MEKIDEHLKNISIAEVPNGVHQFVMRKVNYYHLRPMLFVSFILLAFNFLIIAWHINAKLIDAEFIDMTQDFFEIFKFNFSFINTMWTSFFEIISPMLFLSAFLSLIGAIYTGKEISFYQFSKT
jgi:hypothetical protein